MISVVVPVWNEASRLPATLERVRATAPSCEIVVADGGSADGSVAAARAAGAAVVECGRGRARQMNAGARATRGEIILFLHADCRVEPGWAEAVERAVGRRGRVGGCLEQRIDAAGPAFAVISGLARARARVLRVFYGDQGIFVRRELFFSLGGFREEMPFLEDIELSRRLRRAGPVEVAPAGIVSSARDWRRHGVLRTILRNWGIAALYGAGVPAARLAPWYPALGRRAEV